MSLDYDPLRGYGEQVAKVMRACVDALGRYPARAENYWLKSFPANACEVTAWVVGSVLFERGYGDWTLVAGLIDSEAGLTQRWGGHAWLERRQEGVVAFTLDPTAHQFPEWSSVPILVEGESQLAQYFTVNLRHNVISMPREWHGDHLHRPPLKFVREQLRDR